MPPNDLVADPPVWFELKPFEDDNKRELLKKCIRSIESQGSTAFIDAVDYALKNCSYGATIVAMTDGQTNCGLGLNQCPRLGH